MTLPPGTYIGRAHPTRYDWGQSDNGAEYCTVELSPSEGEFVGERIVAYLYFTQEKNSKRSIESLRHLGCTFPGGDYSNMTGLGSKDAQFVVEQEEYPPGSGTMKTKVKWINPLMAVKNPMSAADKKAFSERMRKYMGDPEPTPQTGSAPSSNSNVPF